MIFRKKSTSFKGILPNLSSTYQNTVHTRRKEDTHKVAIQELQEETMLEQRRRCAWARVASGLGDLHTMLVWFCHQPHQGTDGFSSPGQAGSASFIWKPLLAHFT